MVLGEPPCRYGGQLAAQGFKSYLERQEEDGEVPMMPYSLADLLRTRCCFKPDERPASVEIVGGDIARPLTTHHVTKERNLPHSLDSFPMG